MPDEPMTACIPCDDLSALLRVSLALAESLDLGVVLQTAVDAAVSVLGLDTGVIYLIEGDDLLLGAAAPVLPSDFPDSLRATPLAEHAHILRALATREAVMVADIAAVELTEAEREAVEVRGLTSVMYIPLVVHGAPEGVMIVGTHGRVRPFGAPG